jgi:nucleoside phosphorylase
MTARVLLVCPHPFEAREFRDLFPSCPRSLQTGTTVQGPMATLLIGGIGGETIRATLATIAPTAREFSQAVLFGLAGGLSPHLHLGEVFQGMPVLRSGSPALSCAPDPRFSPAPLLTVDQGIFDPAQRQALQVNHGADLVDMEGWHFADWCQSVGLPWLIVRVISDNVAHPSFSPKHANVQAGCRQARARLFPSQSSSGSLPK